MAALNLSPITPSTTKIGWIGIGIMGSAMASRLLSAGYSLTIYARTPSKADPLLALGAHLAASPADVAKSSDVVFTMLGHPQDVRQIVLTKKTGVLSGLSSNGVVIDHTSSHPELAKEIFAAAREKDCWAIDAPVSGGDVGARNGNLVIFAGGERSVVNWLLPLLEIMGSKVSFMGGPGSGLSCKIANQIMVGANLVGLSEGLVFAGKAGLDRRGWMEAVRGGAAGSMVMELFGQKMIDRDYDPGGITEYIVKDIGMGLDFAEGRKGGDEDEVVVIPGASLSKQLFVGIVANGDGKVGIQGLISVIERINGI
ncbi:probable 3-hydroxyisobutyrate dehydrogenase-like 2, mitochondrial [Chenopodium quinoa]|uniref:3-hydroxyisobutyrate dehydrogenase-like 2, mitochondrial n=1 Tax=Chenopodium quinoa TaxID=63459 RepID=A0A803LJW1_CHEQI|nr:probable 3-hydroxyisobutyrate dehydrogenase-like 2, mitochondrial [Chenopodium quinoa]XP_021727377.1 probable 3-hydroxyisobutyrate dehydrogenase-like 2, mitochondrial [Chenopodium quinoa]